MLALTNLPVNLLVCRRNGNKFYKTAGFPSPIKKRIRVRPWRSLNFTKKVVAIFGIRWATPPHQEALDLHPFQVRQMPPTLRHRRLSTRPSESRSSHKLLKHRTAL